MLSGKDRNWNQLRIPDLFSPRQGSLNPAKQGPSPRPAAEFPRAKTAWSPLLIAIHQRYRPSPAVPLWWVPLIWARFVEALADPAYAEQFNTARRTKECSLEFVSTVFRELLEVATWSSGRNIWVSNARLAARTGRSPRHVRRATALLEQFGWIVAHYRGTGGGQNDEHGPNIARLRYASNPLLEAARRQITATTSNNTGPCENVPPTALWSPRSPIWASRGDQFQEIFLNSKQRRGCRAPRGTRPPPKTGPFGLHHRPAALTEAPAGPSAALRRAQWPSAASNQPRTTRNR